MGGKEGGGRCDLPAGLRKEQAGDVVVGREELLLERWATGAGGGELWALDSGLGQIDHSIQLDSTKTNPCTFSSCMHLARREVTYLGRLAD